MENSCNPGFVALGQRLGKESLFSYIKDFGFGTKTGIDLSGEASGILFKLSRVGPVELATTAFGQGVSVTPIQQVAAVSAAINGGKLYKPYVTKAWVHPVTGEVMEEAKPELVRQVISENTSKQVREALESVVAKVPGVRHSLMDTGSVAKQVQPRRLSMDVIPQQSISYPLSDLHRQMTHRLWSIPLLIIPKEFSSEVWLPPRLCRTSLKMLCII